MQLTKGSARKVKAEKVQIARLETHTSEEYFALLDKIRAAGCVVYGVKTLRAGPHYEIDTNYDPTRLL